MMGTRRIVGRMILTRLCAPALGLLLAVAASAPSALADDTAGRSSEDVLSLQRRLTDAGCYKAAIDGAPSAALDAAVKACPDQSPFLRIETGMHTAPIRRIGVDASCRRIATASQDKTVRLWSLPDGRLERTIRAPIGAEHDGMLYAIALSPDGRRLAAGGLSGSYSKLGSNNLSLFDLDSGSIRRVGAFPREINAIAFSADGRSRGDRPGRKKRRSRLRLDVGRRNLRRPRLCRRCLRVAFAPDGSLISSSFDGQLRRYGPDYRLTAKRGSLAGKQPYGLMVDRAGRRLAVGFDDAPKASIFDATTLAPLAEADSAGLANGSLSDVAWSRDGATLVSGAQAQWNGV